MALAESHAPTDPRRWRWRAVAFLLILSAAGLHIGYFCTEGSLDLAPDEAHYWDWSRHLDWSYYSKGPLVAYLIRASCELLGPWSCRLIGNEMAAVRLPAVLCGSLLLASLYVLTVQVHRREKLAVAVVALTLTLPVIAAGSSLMTIDAPYTCCWGWALVLGHRAVFRGSWWAWPAAGLVVGLGILAKYTMVLWIPSLGLFLLATRYYRPALCRPGFWILSAVAAACCLPILVWNAQHGWPGLWHVSGQAGLHHASDFRWWGPLSFAAAQAGILLGFWFVAWLASLWVHRPGRETDPHRLLLWWMSVPMFAVFLLFSFKTAGEPNWPVTAYISGMVLAAGWLAQQLRSPRTGYRRLANACLAAACGLGLGLTILMHHSQWARPVLAQLSGPARRDRPLPLRRLDPTCRLRGWRMLAAAVDRQRQQLRREEPDPVLAATGWTLPGELAFYCEDHPTVYSLGLALGDRHSQYDFWRPNPVLDPERFAGKTMIVVGDSHPALLRAFRKVEPARTVTYTENGQPIARWTVTVYRGFQGFPKPPPSGRW
jgi:hypothetical protein